VGFVGGGGGGCQGQCSCCGLLVLVWLMVLPLPLRRTYPLLGGYLWSDWSAALFCKCVCVCMYVQGTGCILADFMGLGKTFQVICTLQVVFSLSDAARRAIRMVPRGQVTTPLRAPMVRQKKMVEAGRGGGRREEGAGAGRGGGRGGKGRRGGGRAKGNLLCPHRARVRMPSLCNGFMPSPSLKRRVPQCTKQCWG
jgi:hypothetical protein